MIKWPPYSKILCKDLNNKIIAESIRGKLDLADSLMLYHYEEYPLVCYVEVSTKSGDWLNWDSDNVERIESHIHYDLEFDGYKVVIERFSELDKSTCKEPFRWLIKVSPAYSDEVE